MKCAIVDDHAMVRAGLREVIKTVSPGMTISEADGFQGLRRILEEAPDHDLVFLDLFIPDIHGFDGLRLLRRDFPAISVVVVSSSEDPAYIEEAFRLRASGYIPKSLAGELLPHALKLIFAGGVFVPPCILSAGDTERNLTDKPQNDSENLPVDADQRAPSPRLTQRQRQILSMMRNGLSNDAISERLGLSRQTIKNHSSQIYRALGVVNRRQAGEKAQDLKI